MIKLLNPILRFTEFESMGTCKRLPDTRTTEQLRESIHAWARQIPEVKQILPKLDNMNPKHFGLIADTIELSQKPATTYLDVDMLHPEKNTPFFAPLDKLMAVFPMIGDKNPHALDFSKEVIENAGKLTSKFFLKSAADLDFLLDNGVDKNYELGTKVVEPLAKKIIDGPKGNEPLSRQKVFVGHVLSLIDKDADLDKISLLEELYGVMRKRSAYVFDMESFIMSKAPVDVIKENIKTLDDDLAWCYSFGKCLDANEYLIRNLDDKRIPYYGKIDGNLQYTFRK